MASPKDRFYKTGMRYYANGRVIERMEDDQVPDRPFFLIVHTESGYTFPPELQPHFQQLYSTHLI
jgi:hypothetical protein